MSFSRAGTYSSIFRYTSRHYLPNIVYLLSINLYLFPLSVLLEAFLLSTQNPSLSRSVRDWANVVATSWPTFIASNRHLLSQRNSGADRIQINRLKRGYFISFMTLTLARLWLLHLLSHPVSVVAHVGVHPGDALGIMLQKGSSEGS